MSKRDPWVLTSLGLVAVTAIVASFGTLMHLAAWVGWSGGWMQLMLPVCLDILALGSGRVWLSSSMSIEARRFARIVSLAAIGISIVGNAIGHIVAMSNTSPVRIFLAIIVGSIPPASLAAVGHLFTLTSLRVEAEQPVEQEAPVEDEPAEPEQPEPVRETPKRSGGRPPVKETAARAYWDSEREEGRTPTGADLARAAEADKTMGPRWVKKFEAQDEADKAKSMAGAKLALVGN